MKRLRRAVRAFRQLMARNAVDTLSWGVAIVGILAAAAAAALTGNAALSLAVGIAAAAFRWGLSVFRTERAYGRSTAEERRLEPLRHDAAEGIALAAVRAIRARILYRDIPAAHPREMFTSILELSQGADPEANWTPTEADQIRLGIERVIAAFKTDVGPYVVDVPHARADVHGVVNDLENSADALLEVVHAANKGIDARLSGDEAGRSRAREARLAAVEKARDLLRSAVARAMRLIEHDSSPAAS